VALDGLVVVAELLLVGLVVAVLRHPALLAGVPVLTAAAAGVVVAVDVAADALVDQDNLVLLPVVPVFIALVWAAR
jgi:hypothetical protein